MKKSTLFALSMLAFVGGTAYSFQMTVNNKSSQILQVLAISDNLSKDFITISPGKSHSFDSGIYPITGVTWKRPNNSMGTVSITQPLMQIKPVLQVYGTFDISNNDASSYNYALPGYANSAGTQRVQK